MELFDLELLDKYESPDPSAVDMRETRKRVELFFKAYFEARCRAGQPREPKITASFSDCPPASSNENKAEAESILIYNDEARAEFEYWENLYQKGLSGIQKPLSPEITQRRKKIFTDRYVYGYSIYETAKRSNTCESMVKKETAKAVIQFTSTLDIVILRQIKQKSTYFVPNQYPFCTQSVSACYPFYVLYQ